MGMVSRLVGARVLSLKYKNEHRCLHFCFLRKLIEEVLGMEQVYGTGHCKVAVLLAFEELNSFWNHAHYRCL